MKKTITRIARCGALGVLGVVLWACSPNASPGDKTGVRQDHLYTSTSQTSIHSGYATVSWDIGSGTPFAGVFGDNRNSGTGNYRADIGYVLNGVAYIRVAKQVNYPGEFYSGVLQCSGGTSNNVVAVGDFNGDGRDDLVFHENDVFKIFYVTLDQNNQLTCPSVPSATYTWGTSSTSTKTVFAGDFDGNGYADLALYNSANSTWYVRFNDSSGTPTFSSSNQISQEWRVWSGFGKRPFVGDWDGDGRTDIGDFYEPSNYWYFKYSYIGMKYTQTVTYVDQGTYFGAENRGTWGSNVGDIFAADWDGDGHSDIGYYDASSKQFVLATITTPTGRESTGCSLSWSDYHEDRCDPHYYCATFGNCELKSPAGYIQTASNDQEQCAISWATEDSDHCGNDENRCVRRAQPQSCATTDYVQGCRPDETCHASFPSYPDGTCYDPDNFTYGTCGAKFDAGAECRIDRDCKSDRCEDKKCRDCSSNSDCASYQACKDRICTDKKGVGGSLCDFADQCFSGVCHLGICRECDGITQNMGECNGSYEFCSLTGYNCVDKKQGGAYCSSYHECLSNSCLGAYGVGVCVGNGSTANRPSKTGTYKIKTKNGKCLDTTSDVNDLVQYACEVGKKTQEFELRRVEDKNDNDVYEIRHLHSSKCVDVSGGSSDMKANVIMYACGSSDNQRFYLKPDTSTSDPDDYVLEAKHSRMCLDLYKGSSDEGTNIQQWYCTGGSPQSFKLVPLKVQVLTSTGTPAKCVDIQGSGTNLIQYTCHGGANQAFEFVWSWSKYFEIHHPDTSRCWDGEGNSTANGTNLAVYGCHGGDNQLFYRVWDTSTSDPYDFILKYKRNADLCVDVHGGGNDNKANMNVWTCNGGAAQRFTLQGLN